MNVGTIGAASAQASTPSKSDIATQKLVENTQDFLLLLTAQIRHQDPLQPMDSEQFVTQLAQLSQVEQSVTTNQNLEGIQNTLSNSSIISDLSLISREVEAESAQVRKTGDATSFEYRLDSMAEEVVVKILDSSGKPVRSLDMRQMTPNEPHEVVWDGRDDAGAALPDGIYHLSVAAQGADEAAVTASTFVRAKVESVTFEGGSPRLILSNGQDIASSQIRTVSAV
jgi:flagellar basal-body rod modification protein FlgD